MHSLYISARVLCLKLWKMAREFFRNVYLYMYTKCHQPRVLLGDNGKWLKNSSEIYTYKYKMSSATGGLRSPDPGGLCSSDQGALSLNPTGARLPYRLALSHSQCDGNKIIRQLKPPGQNLFRKALDSSDMSRDVHCVQCF